MKSFFSLFGIILVLELLPVGASDGTFVTGQANPTTYAPLILLTQGDGWVVRFENGQMLPVGREFRMSGVPKPGYEFAYWSPVSVFTDSEIIYSADDVPIETNNIVTISVSQQQIQSRSLEFTVQPAEVIVDIPGVRTLTRSAGWQATFVRRR